MTAEPTLSLLDVAGYLPENRVPATYFEQFAEDDQLAGNAMFRMPAHRHHAAHGETSADMMIAAARTLTARHGEDWLDDVDVVLTHSQLPEVPVRGCGGEVAHRLGLRPHTVLDVHNGGCAAFPHMVELADGLLRGRGGGKAVIALAQNSASQVFTQEQVRGKAQAPIPGDGAAMAVVSTDGVGSPVLGVRCHSYGQYSGDMTAVATPDRKYWEAGPGQIHIGFTDAKITKVLARGNRMVPEVAIEVADAIGVAPAELDWLITNQPNRIFLRNWAEALELPAERHPDTFDECGNLFGVAIPLTLDTAITDGRIAVGDVVMTAAFAHAGDFAGALALRWCGR
ncbi:3-Oxoacyl-(acyl-carrier-protein (ACP)) synthase III domain protein [Gordonia bronchialis DSM 43247]|uniref:3-Oxoacyl-(Acyl-carrier-protein (ACP)) synthase III domain protein n=1 Tax=Gordonia bronchialis (strain ATCC 25592 / DSM 43247 / BCRC 13721 / JCM 3198 / KCTC 3076 / NBRC 16047 / NCTC 10667) TaxID=526226 RepID=D0L5T6_GORB4|nr:3-oxoacyl-[acyl-carrier-protein] synthase III C-terminal domain-containing protein [Gordonia bronchialis]ACY20615.1 3-Oxoacyl-(acyl-carrier-protein (ACP)) synthase III domain protein [Gordonia bronchialis DSM 43247]MCC3323390.1 3-oxoacyl-ACP synthase [Gordonia bronchialis]QGS25619.1 3-oxoacyl-ACP synthase [Gordonia bronchialis]UAK37974.1 3-oxoacyl-ACP synthase [Gordonia bronchialis]STQ63441.1 3-oxoacyl-[acyl-carrier-protein] synthase 3 [Gordonia bronchialis]